MQQIPDRSLQAMLARAGPESLRLAPTLLIGACLVIYYFLSALPGIFGWIPCLLIGLYIWWRSCSHIVNASPPLGTPRTLILSAACVAILLLDHIQHVYRPVLGAPGDASHPAVETLVDAATLNELGIGPHFEGVFFAPGEGERDLYLWAGNKRRSYLSLVAVLAARRTDVKDAPWRVGFGRPLSDARWIAQTGRILTTIPEPPMVELRDPATLAVADGITWTPGGYPTLIDVSPDGPVRIFAEGEGQVVTLDPRTLAMEVGEALAPRARAIGALIEENGIAPSSLSAPIEGRRYLTSWYAYMTLLELDESLKVTRFYEQAESKPRMSSLSVYRFFDTAYDPAGDTLWIANGMNGRAGEIIQIRRESLARVASYPAPIGLRRILYDPERRRLYALGSLTGELVVYDNAAGALTEHARLKLGRMARVLQWEDESRRKLLVGSAAGLFRVDPMRL